MGDFPQTCPRCGQSHLVITGIAKTIDPQSDPRKQIIWLASLLMAIFGFFQFSPFGFALIGLSFVLAIGAACLPATRRTKLSCPNCQYDTFADELPRRA